MFASRLARISGRADHNSEGEERMQYRRLGRAGVKISELALGSWITAGGNYPLEVSVATHRRAFELGITTFDTADIYNLGQAEQALGLARKDWTRTDVVLATKCAASMGSGPNDAGLSRKHVREACDASLRRLGTEYIDLYQAHRFDAETPLEETCRAFDDLVRAGKILYWGVSNWSGAQLAGAVGICGACGYDAPVSLQPRYNLFARELESDPLPVCDKLGLGVMVYSPLSQGLLTGKYLTGVPTGSRAENRDDFQRFLNPYNRQAVQELSVLAQAAGLTLAQLALAWILRTNAVSAAIVGASRPEQLDELVKASGVKLPGDLLAGIQKILERRRAAILEEDARALRAQA
jgi:aryl-alcohol dehydrogenase-like predicted oxidoreductase